MINALVHKLLSIDLITCQFPHGPTACIHTPYRIQPGDISRGGTLYSYDRGVGFNSWKLTYKTVPGSLLTVLEMLVDVSGGAARKIIYWYDHEGVTRTVRFKGPITAKETAPDNYQVSFVLEDC